MAAVPHVPMPNGSADARMPLLDAVKGMACVLIVGHHLARYGPMADSALTLAPSLFGWLAQHGRLAVQVFLVLAGFLAASSLAPDGLLRVERPMARVARRYARLVMPYLAALSCSVVVAALVRPWLNDAARARWLAVALVLGLVAASLAGVNRDPALDDTALYFFGAYGLGMLVFWIGRATRDSTWRLAALLLALLGAGALALDWRSRIAIALVAALAIAVAQRRQWLWPTAWPALWQPLVQLGEMSYSLFLIHFPVILLVNTVVQRWWPDQAWPALWAMGFTVALSLAAGRVLYRQVETRAASWQAVLTLFAGLLACGALSAA